MATAAGELPKGAVIGRYLVLGLVGRGGMGEVYAAYDPELDRKVAVKLLRGQSSDLDARARLLREAQAIAKLSHPNVVIVFDVGTYRDTVFVAMEFVEGNTVGYWLQAGKRSWPEIMEIFTAAGRGLAAAHAAGMVHRDFKPDNVMISRDGQIRVMDFGLARRLGEGREVAPAPTDSGRLAHLMSLGEEAVAPAPPPAAPEVDLDATARLGPAGVPRPILDPSPSARYLEQKLTVTGAMLGTPAYMAPEQFASVETDARTDQFSFCVALYEALYGHRPFEGDTLVALMTNVVSGTVREAPAGTEVPARLRRVLLRGLEVDPERRWSSMTELLAALAPPQTPASRSRTVLAIVAAAAVAAALAVVARRAPSAAAQLCGGADSRLAGVWERTASSSRKEALRGVFLSKAKSNGARLFAGASGLLDGFVGRWADMYRDACEATHVRGEQSAEVLDLRMACLGQRLGDLKAVTDVLMTADAATLENAATAVGSLPSLEACADVETLKSVMPPPTDPKARVRVEELRRDVARARALGDAGQCAQASTAAIAAVEAAKQVSYAPLLAEAHYVNGRVGNFCGNGSAIDSLEEAIYAAEASHHDEIAVMAAVCAGGFYADRFHDTRAGRRWLRYSDAIRARLPNHPVLEAFAIQSWGILEQAEGKYADAVREQERALAIKEQVLGPLHPDTAISHMNLSCSLHDLGRDSEGEPHGARAVETFERLLGPEAASVAVSLYDWAENLTAVNRLPEARHALERAISIWTKAGASEFFIAAGRVDLARIDLLEKHPREARERVEGAVEILAKQDPQLGAQARLVLAQALWPERRDRARAVGVAREARTALVKASAPAPKLAEVDAWLASHTTP